MNSHLRFYSMKKILLFYICLLFSCVITAQESNATYTVPQQCKELLKNFQVIDARKTKIKQKAQIVYTDSVQLKEFNAKLDSALVLCEKILKEAPNAYEKAKDQDTGVEYARSALQNVHEYITKSLDEFFTKTEDSNTKKISYDLLTIRLSKEYSEKILDAYIPILSSNYDEISRITSTGNVEDKEINGTNTGETPNNRETLDYIKELPLEFCLILALNFILFVLGVILIISHNRVHKRLDEHGKALRSIEEFDIIKDIKKRINELEQKSKNPANNDSLRGGGVSHSNSDLNNLRTEILGEIKKLKEEIGRLKSSANTSFGGIPNANSTEQKIAASSRNEQNHPKTLKGIYAQLQGNGSFKTYDSDRTNAFFIIVPNSTGTIGEFSLKELTPEIAKLAIDDRNSLLIAACEIVETSANPKKIKVESFGAAEKRGNEWYVKDKAKISLVD